jgi:hypothetical protein
LCTSPFPAWRLEDGTIVFSERGKVLQSLWLPCGQCVECRLERSRQWAVRVMHEASLWKENSYITLTYDDEHLPPDRSLRYEDFQLFMKRLRKHFTGRRVRFYMCGEYGETTHRPHYHACLFNVGFADKLYFKSTNGFKLYTSRLLRELWPLGSHLVGDVSFQSAAYVARYCMTKVTGQFAGQRCDVSTGEISRFVPEFNHMSLKPGIGAMWFDRFKSDVFPLDHVVVRGSESRPPRYYDVKLARVDPDMMERVVQARYDRMVARGGDSSDGRLLARDVVNKAKVRRLVRSL